MLTLKKYKEARPECIALLLFISIFTSQSHVFADSNSISAENYRDIGYIQQQKGNLPEALSSYIKAAQMGLDSPVVYNDIAIIYEKIDLLSKAEYYYKLAIATDEDYLPAYMNLAYFYLANGQDELAFQFFKKRFVKTDEDDPWGQKAKEELLKIHPEFITWVVTQEAKRLDEELVIKAHEEFANRIGRASAHYKRAQRLEGEGKYSRAMTEYDHALALTPDNPKIVQAKKKLVMRKAKEEFERRSAHAAKMLENGNTLSAREEIRNMLATIPNE